MATVSTVAAGALASEALASATTVEETARVTEIAAGTVTAVAERDGRTFKSVSYTGFPEGVLPRVGDLVTVTDRVSELGLVALPLCSWTTGTPSRDSKGVVSLNGVKAAPSQQLSAAGQSSVLVALMGTTLPDAQVLDVRSPSTA
ncbi:hypothetical protein ACWEPL_63910 [Nonomuraea sp. NPDC004186]|uniref:hypothetical protein n=1 Tax=Nonomuraea sp. NPDC049625 TaxID=3155775 RepID=UPI0034272E8C